MPLPFNRLPPEFLDLNEMGTQSRGVSVLYGRRTDGSLVAVQVDANGVLASNLTVPSISIGSVTIDPGVAHIGSVGLDTGSNSIGNVGLNTGSNTIGKVGLTASTNAFFRDRLAGIGTGPVLTNTFQQIAFGFTSFSISLYNDDSSAIIEYSFDGTNIHGRLLLNEAVAMDFRAQTGVWLRTMTGYGPAADYRVSSY